MKRLVRHIAMQAVAVALVCGGAIGSASSASAVDVGPDTKPQPGLPYLECFRQAPLPNATWLAHGCGEPAAGNTVANWNSWYNFAQVGRVGSLRSQQWSRLPLTMVAGNAQFFSDAQKERARDQPKVGSSLPANSTWERLPAGTPVTLDTGYLVQAFFVSPKGSDEDYGLAAPMTIRTVAFGSIPAEITIEVANDRDANGLPVPVTANARDWQQLPENYTDGDNLIQHTEPTVLDGKVAVNVTRIKVDGVDVGLRDGCGTGPRARLRATSDTLDAPQGDFFNQEYLKVGDARSEGDPKNMQAGLSGGTLEGSIDIPAFSSCRTASGDDISPLLTSMISSADNPLSIRLGSLTCLLFTDQGALPAPPGQNDPRDPGATCGAFGPKAPAVPERFKVVPFDGPVRPYD